MIRPLLIHNAHLLSFQEGFVKGNDSIVIEGDRIKAVGRYNELQSMVHSQMQILDAKGKTIMPGFNDTHIHIWKVGNLMAFMLDLRDAKSLEEMLSMLSDYSIRHPDAEWITARGFNEACWIEGRMPTADDLDSVISDKPVYVIRTCAHIAVVNSRAMQIAGIDTNTVFRDGGEIHHGANGRPNGIFSESALGLITNHIPEYTKRELKTMIRAAREKMYSYGITAATDPAVDPLLLETYYEMHHQQELGFRLHAIPILLPDGSENPYPIPQLYASSFFTVNSVKFFSDGGLSGKTAALKRAYKHSSEHGILRLKKDSYLKLCRASMQKGLGIATHAIGDAAIGFVIDIYKELDKTFPGIIKRIEHLGLPEEKHLQDMASYHVAASMQPIFINELGKNFRKYLDDEYLDHCYPIKSVIQNGIITALSSDAPVVKNFNPLKGIEVAVTRKDSEGNTIGASESITIGEALKAYTLDSAAISSSTGFGTLEEGSLADIIILNKDPLTMPAEQLTGILVEKTFVGGNMVWER